MQDQDSENPQLDSTQPDASTNAEFDDSSIRVRPDGAESPKCGVVVGIGASAGGLETLRTFFQQIPSDSGLAFVVVVHLSPEYESHLAEILQPHAKIPVMQVTQTLLLEANHAYVIPPGRNLSAVDTHLRLDKLESQIQQRAPIDHFFRTLAKTHDGQSIGIILTGTGSDGTLGLRAIKGCGGSIIVQDPNDAQYDGMPQSAIATGMVDFVLPIAKIPQKLLSLARSAQQVALPIDEESLSDEQRNTLHKIFAQIRSRVGRDFSRYKSSTIMRRIARRMQLSQIADLADYLQMLREDLKEIQSLADDLLITVTNFFRDGEVFDLLEREIIPGLFQNKSIDDEVRIWSVGCATGEEAYSLAILLLENSSKMESPPKVTVFASDLHEHSLGRARDGFYPGDIATDVSPQRLKRFFVKVDGGYRIRKEIRELVIFTPHNLLGDPPFSRLNLISCRNVMIYLQRDIQKEIIELFHYALRPEGVRLLGTSETADDSELFHVVSKKKSVYRKRNVPAREPRLPVFPLASPRVTSDDARFEYADLPAAYGTLHSRMVERYAPPSMLITPDDKVVHLSEHAGRFLVHPGGELTSSAIKLIREELRLELRSILHSARENSRPIRSNAVSLTLDDQHIRVTMDARPATASQREDYVLVIFNEDAFDPASIQSTDDLSVANAQSIHIPSDDHLTGQLQTELDATRQHLQLIVEVYETSQEEMKASNEELQSANEELRSTMEELETSKEELQSMNEELQTVNQENRHKVEELAQLSSDLQNLLAATSIATLFLDRELRILRFTPATSELFNIRQADSGRPISDFTHRLGYVDMLADCQRVLKDLIPIECEVQDDSQRWFLTRLLPYRSNDDRIEGVVMTLVDITHRKRAEQHLQQSQQRYRLLIESATEYAILMLDRDGSIQLWNRGAQRMFGYGEEEALRQPGSILWTPEDRANGVVAMEMNEAIKAGHSVSDRWRRRKDGTRFRGGGVITAIRDDHENHTGFAVVMRDNTERSQTENMLQESEARLRLACEATGFGTYDYDIGNDRAVWLCELLRLLKLPQSTVVERNILLDFIHPEDSEEFLANFNKTISSIGEGHHDRQFRVIIDDEVRWLRDVGHTFYDDDDAGRRPVRIVGMIQDITAQKEHEASLEDARAIAEAANQSRGEFLANMSHEIRTPMTAILGHVDILGELLEDPEHRKYLETVRHNGTFLLGILNDILDLSKIDAGKLSIEREPVDLPELLTDVRSLMEIRAADKGIELSIQFGSLLPQTIQSDEIRLRQILLNLLGNAIKFTHQGTVRLMATHLSESSQLRFEVIDTGIGISSERMEDLFQPFSQVDNSDSRRYGGTGLGLVICRRLAHMFGGEVSARSEPGVGSTFIVEIDCQHKPDVKFVMPIPLAHTPTPPTHSDIQLSGNVLVTDDRRDIRFLVTRLIEAAGIETFTADNGRDAVEIVRSQMQGDPAIAKPLDAILMDMQMPEMDGYEATRQIRALGFKGPIIALTANAMEGDRARCVAAGCNDYLTKPIDGPELLSLLTSILATPKT